MTSKVRSASVYLRRGFYYVHPLAGSDGGDPALLVEPVTKLEVDVAANALGEVVLRALALSHHQAPWPTDWKRVTEPLYRAAGVKSESTFMSGAKYVRVNLIGHEVSVMPTTSKEHRNAFSPLADRAIEVSLDEPYQLGAAVVQALAISD
jgi:hypothetical protein